MNLNPAIGNKSASIVAAGLVNNRSGASRECLDNRDSRVAKVFLSPWRGRQSAEGRVLVLAFLALLTIVCLGR
jgi:hypothetical protein